PTYPKGRRPDPCGVPPLSRATPHSTTRDYHPPRENIPAGHGKGTDPRDQNRRGGGCEERRPMPAEEGTTDLATRLDRIESLLATLVERQRVKEWYTTAEAAKVLGKTEFTVREWCRLRRCHARKQRSGRGAHTSWIICHEEILRIEREGLLPVN